VLLGFGLGRTVNPATAAGLRGCLETAARQDPSNPDIWMALANVVRQQRVWGWGLPPGEASIERRGALADRQLQAALRAVDLAPHDNRAQAALAYGYYAKCQLDRFRPEARKALALNPYDADNLGGIGVYLAFSGSWDEGTSFAQRAIELMGPEAEWHWWLGLRSATGSVGNTRKPTRRFSDPTSTRFGFRISISPTRCRSSDASMRPSACRDGLKDVSVDADPRGRCVL
jgi:tetratricopeptide (TPR) repeat protein